MDRAVNTGTDVGVRLNLNLSTPERPVLTVHQRSFSGPVLAYTELPVLLLNVKFSVNQRARRAISEGRSNKYPMASVDGTYVHVEPEAVPTDGVLVTFNPKRDEFFNVAGERILFAGSASVIGSKVYARDVVMA